MVSSSVKKHYINSLSINNIVNLLILNSLVFYFGKQFLTKTLVARQQKVFTAIQEAEKQLELSKLRVEESEKQLEQTSLVIKQIISEAENTAQKIRASILVQGKSEIDRLALTTQNSIINAEVQIKNQIQKHIVSIAIERVSIKLKQAITAEQHQLIIDKNISKLGGL
uniref:ATP synthase subunit b, chloroplastic n=1 Tax=Bulboplastis apyrenoidosa TaxID=1070855 RepID=A0A1Y9TME0_9RHOD|nr:ATP synthase CF0 subunit B [Bulboplastis apyrenoidosa]ARO90816.1 ATP synthase CF0 subunit B [Bulboplastis apyrenoidosa]